MTVEWTRGESKRHSNQIKLKRRNHTARQANFTSSFALSRCCNCCHPFASICICSQTNITRQTASRLTTFCVSITGNFERVVSAIARAVAKLASRNTSTTNSSDCTNNWLRDKTILVEPMRVPGSDFDSAALKRLVIGAAFSKTTTFVPRGFSPRLRLAPSPPPLVFSAPALRERVTSGTQGKRPLKDSHLGGCDARYYVAVLNRHSQLFVEAAAAEGQRCDLATLKSKICIHWINIAARRLSKRIYSRAIEARNNQWWLHDVHRQPDTTS